MSEKSTSPAELETATTATLKWRAGMPAMEAANSVEPNNMITWMADEVVETEQEHNREGLLYNFFEHSAELTDVLVLLMGYCVDQGLSLNFIDACRRANGQGNCSPVYELLYEKALNLAEGDIQKNVDDFLLFVISLSNHLPEEYDAIASMEYVIKKNSANRPQEYYQNSDPQGRVLSLEAMSQLKKHAGLVLRQLRNHYSSPLPAWIHPHFKDLIENYQDSAVALQQLPQRIKEVDALLASQALALLSADIIPQQQPLTTARLEKQLLLAGAVLINFPTETIYSAAA